jgi:hypothetical protein
MHSGIQNLARKAFHSLGALHLVRGYHRSALRVLLYHRFTSPERDLQEQITRQCEHLRRYYSPVAEGRVLEWFAGGPPLPPNAVLVSVDDGPHGCVAPNGTPANGTAFDMNKMV